jgi:hypothetical protein
LLQAYDRERFGERHVVEVDFTRWDGDVSKLSDKTLDQLLEKLRQKQAADRGLPLPPSEAVIEISAEDGLDVKSFFRAPVYSCV